jgi:hypothetical protein
MPPAHPGSDSPVDAVADVVAGEGVFALEAFAAAADLAGLGGLFCWGWWVRSFSFWGQVVGFGAPGFAGAGVGPADDEFAGGGQLGVEAAAGFE